MIKRKFIITGLMGLAVGLGSVAPQQTSASVIKQQFKYGLLKTTQAEYKNADTSTVFKTGKTGDFITIKKLVTNKDRQKRFKLSNGTFVVADTNNVQKITNSYKKYYVHVNSTRIIKAKKGFAYYKTVNSNKKVGHVSAGSYVHVTGIGYTNAGTPMLKAANGSYLTANREFVSTSKGYQNPKRYLQVQNTKIKPTGTIGYTLKHGYEGVKTWKIKRHLGIGGQGNYE
ncbi:DUF5776 domain-containing protein [Pediococcus argentinicus]|uniref:DUF5776 domain-containing protein n=1 Tax=Pediococcus argentinicus TaxID=480391 RepID=UPI00338DE22E